MERLTATGPVLVHFFDFSQLNAVRTLPYLRAWHERYADSGLTVLGVHTPRHPFGEDPAAVAEAVERLAIPYPVLSDEKRAAWAAYGCVGWPSLFLWSRGGALRWFQFGEGDYRGTEEAIQEQLSDLVPLEPLAPLRPTDAPGARLLAPADELLPGGSEREPWRASSAAPALEIDFAGAGASAALDGEGKLELRLDGEPLAAIEVDGPGLYELVTEGPHREGLLEIRPDPSVAVYAVGFAPALAGETVI